ncbi:MAG: PAS domain-containing sensor histidine kinase [Muribaculaceae bacterium]|nr:PAS domain-containing sensor histidine kinase [Muribaculaceae bacterium]
MKPSLSFVILSLSLLALTILAVVGDIPYWVWYIPIGCAIFTTLVIYRGAYLPQNAVARGMELIQSQDYNNRLVKVGEHNADRIVCLFNSLIDKLRAERLLNREQESLLTLLIDASPMGVVMLDFNGMVSMVNSSFLKMSGYQAAEELRGKNIKDISYDMIPDMMRVPLGKAEVIRKGNFRIYRCYHLNFVQEGFKREFYLLESLTEEIMKAEKSAYEKVIRTISHEVNNSMGGVRSVLEIVEDEIDSEDIKQVIESCDNRCERMCNFIRAYADVVKLPLPVIKKFDLVKEIAGMTPFLQKVIKDGISLKFVQPKSEIYINGDAVQIQQVILNIVKNATESITSKGFIQIEVIPKQEGVELTISNNGKPISHEESKQLFTPFFTTKPDGKGIGLTFVRDVLNNHMAHYSLMTDSMGITRFTILFPKP